MPVGRRSMKTMVAAGVAGAAVVALVGVMSLRESASNAVAAQRNTAADPVAESASNVRLVGYNDLQGRTALVTTTKSDPANGNWVYIGHHDAFHDDKPILNPITGKMEFNGTSILDITDPAKPKYVWHIPNPTNRNSRSASVVYDYKFDGSGKDYLIRNSEALTQGETGEDLKYEIWDVTTRSTDPSKITKVGEITGTRPNSCGPGCGGKFKQRAHKGWWSQDTGYFYAASGEPGFRNIIVQIFDLKNPKEPRLVGRAWIPGLREGEPGYEGQYSHHPIVDEDNKRLYVGYRNAGGQAASFDISDPAHPKLVWEIDMNPPFRGPHTVSPIKYDTVPNFGRSALPRTYAFVVDEAGGGADMKPCTNGVRTGAYSVDITTETKPMVVSVFQVPVGNFCDKGGRFGPHQSAETVNGKINRFTDKIAWLAYFNAGVRVLDLSDPYNMKELGSYIPKTTKNSYPISKGQPVAIQINDVDIDHRGLAYAVDRAGAGLFVLEYTGSQPRRMTTSY
jgi:hypothetical protein